MTRSARAVRPERAGIGSFTATLPGRSELTDAFAAFIRTASVARLAGEVAQQIHVQLKGVAGTIRVHRVRVPGAGSVAVGDRGD